MRATLFGLKFRGGRMYVEIGVLSFRNHNYHPNRRLMEAARSMGHEVRLLHPAKLYLDVTAEGLLLRHLRATLDLDAVLPRVGSTIREFPLTVVRHVEMMGIRTINRASAISIARNKFRTIQALAARRIPVPGSLYAGNPENLSAAVRRLGGGPVVLKTPQGRQGTGVFLVQGVGQAVDLLKERPELGAGMVVQEFIPPEGRRDLRVLVVGGRVAGAMELTPKKGEFRANYHLGGRASPMVQGGEAGRWAVEASTALGLDISGVDMVVGKNGKLLVVDVNYSPGFRGLEKSTGLDIAAQIIRYAVSPEGSTG